MIYVTFRGRRNPYVTKMGFSGGRERGEEEGGRLPTFWGHGCSSYFIKDSRIRSERKNILTNSLGYLINVCSVNVLVKRDAALLGVN